jgi:hypothetical protein
LAVSSGRTSSADPIGLVETAPITIEEGGFVEDIMARLQFFLL